MDVSLDLLEHFQLKTNFLDDVTQHSIYQSDRPQGLRRVRVLKRWREVRELGSGGSGTVWLEIEDDGSERAVKGISIMFCSRHKIEYKK